MPLTAEEHRRTERVEEMMVKDEVGVLLRLRDTWPFLTVPDSLRRHRNPIPGGHRRESGLLFSSIAAISLLALRKRTLKSLKLSNSLLTNTVSVKCSQRTVQSIIQHGVIQDCSQAQSNIQRYKRVGRIQDLPSEQHVHLVCQYNRAFSRFMA